MRLIKLNLEITVFICGGVVMIFEILGARILAPYFGTSINVWTSIIGIILGSLSLGYYVGGKLADRSASNKNLSVILLFAAIFMGANALLKDRVLLLIQDNFDNLKLSSLISSFVLFTPVSVLLGIISPYAVKLKIKDLSTSGKSVGNLYAISTTGSILGTFLAGFYLIPIFGTIKLLLFLTAILIVCSVLIQTKTFITAQLFVLVFVVYYWSVANKYFYNLNLSGYHHIETSYNSVFIYDENDSIRRMKINNESSSAMLLKSDALCIDYTKYYDLISHFNPSFKSALMIGGAGYSYPKKYLSNYGDATIDVVEIDPTLTKLAQQYFYLTDNKRLKIYHEDARTFLNKNTKKYDAIFGDAFKSGNSIPYQLTTKEAIEKNYAALTSNGVVILNIIASLTGEQSKFLSAEYNTFKAVFPQVYLFPVSAPDSVNKVQNIILVALKSDKIPSFQNNDSLLNKFLTNKIIFNAEYNEIILTDDFAPVDYYSNGAS